MPTFAQLEAAAYDARQKRNEAQARLDQAKAAVRDASLVHYDAVLAKLDQPVDTAKTTGKSKTAAAAADPVTAAQERLDAALAELERVRHDLGLD